LNELIVGEVLVAVAVQVAGGGEAAWKGGVLRPPWLLLLLLLLGVRMKASAAGICACSREDGEGLRRKSKMRKETKGRMRVRTRCRRSMKNMMVMVGWMMVVERLEEAGGSCGDGARSGLSCPLLGCAWRGSERALCLCVCVRVNM
jgi:hypothetical protein